MEDYPRTLTEFESRFGTEEACRDYLALLRWPQGFQCMRCSHPKRLFPKRGVVALRQVWSPNIRDGRHDISGHPQAAETLVSGNVVGDQPEDRR